MPGQSPLRRTLPSTHPPCFSAISVLKRDTRAFSRFNIMQPTFPDLPVWVYFERDPELGGIWVAHVLEFDLVTQGDSLSDALDMALDAAITFLAEVIKRPETLSEELSSRRAPQADWDKLWALFQRAPAQRLDAIVRSEAAFSAMGTQLFVPAVAVLHRAGFGDAHPQIESFPPMPIANESFPTMPVGAVRECA